MRTKLGSTCSADCVFSKGSRTRVLGYAPSPRLLLTNGVGRRRSSTACFSRLLERMWKNGSLPLWKASAPWSSSCVCTALGGACLHGSGLGRDVLVMFWHLLPVQVIGRQAYRIPSISAAEWEEQRALFDEKTGKVWPNAALSARAQFTREYFVNQF